MLISLIVPVYNLKAYLSETVASVVKALRELGEDASGIEVVFVDDGSTDGSGELLASLAAGHGFQVVHKPNGGEGSARNAGIERASGIYLMFLDGDDILLENAFVVALGLVRQNADADIVAMRYAVFENGDVVPLPSGSGEVRRYDLRKGIPSEVICRQGVSPTLFRKTAMGDLRFSDLPLGADREYVMSALTRADVIVCSSTVVLGYRIRRGSMARAPWTPVKIRSLNDHAGRGLAVLAASGRHVGRRGAGYLASLIVSEVPARIARLPVDDAVKALSATWVRSVRCLPAEILPWRIRAVRRMVLLGSCSSRFSVLVARVCRALGMA